jgi:Flp pilus assembly protein TadG
MVRRRRTGRRRGTTAVELALVLPVMLLVTFGAIKYGWLFLRAQQITNAARYGARLAIVADATIPDVKARITSLLAAANIVVNSDEITITPPDISTLNVGDAITVEIAIPAARVDIMDVPLFPKVDGNISASVSMAREGF